SGALLRFLHTEPKVLGSTQPLCKMQGVRLALVISSQDPTHVGSTSTAEENVYMLCNELIRTGVADPAGTDLYVVFISNEEKKVPLWHQKAGHSDDGFICWDYHVICIQSRRSKEVLDFVWDLDSDLPFPSPLIQYVSEAIQPLSFGNSRYARLFRVVHAPVFLQSFASDRSHMKDPEGNWIQLPPKYEPIVAE
ncbi:hypothetical protein ACJX0J_029188, partial [Zea mays]